MADDYSDLGAVPVEDYSDLGAVPVSAAQVPGSLASSLSGLAGIREALGVGAAKGLGNFASGAFNLGQKILPGLNVLSNVGVNTNLPQVPESFGASLKSQYPLSFGAGELLGGAAPLAVAPEIDAASVLGRLLPKTGQYLTDTGLGRYLASAMNNTAGGAAVGGLSGPIYNPNQPLSQSIPQGAALGAGIGAAVPLGLGAAGLAGRLADVATANANKIKAAEGDAYSSISDAAKEAKFVADPNLYQQKLQQISNQLENSATGHVNEPIGNDINNRLQNLSEDLKKPNGFTVDGVHGIMRGLNNQIGSFYRAGNYDAARIYGELKDSLQTDLLSSLRNKGLPDLADKFQQTQKNWAQNVVPLRDNPTSPGSIAAQLASAGLVTKLPAPLREFGEIAMGANAAGSPISNMAARFASPYKGGRSQAALNPQVLAPYLNAAAINYLQQNRQGGQNQ